MHTTFPLSDLSLPSAHDGVVRIQHFEQKHDTCMTNRATTEQKQEWKIVFDRSDGDLEELVV